MAENAPGMFPIPLPIIMDEESGIQVQDSKNLERVAVASESQARKNEEIGGTTNDLLQNTLDLNKKKSLPDTQQKQWVKTVKSMFIGLVQNKYFQKSLKAMLGLGKALGKSLLDLIMGLLMFAIFDPSGALLGSLIEMFANIIVWLIKGIATIIPRIVTILKNMIPVIMGAIKSILFAVVDLIPVVIDTLIEFIPALWDALITIVPALIGGIFNAIVRLFDKLGDKFPWFKKVSAFLTNLGNKVSALFKGFGGLSGVFSNIFGNVQKFFSNMISKMGGLERIGSLFQNLIGAIWDLAMSLLPVFIDIFNSVIENFGFLSDAFAEYIPLLMEAWTMIAKFLIPVFQVLGWIISNVLVPVIAFLVKSIIMTIVMALKITIGTINVIVDALTGIGKFHFFMMSKIKKLWKSMIGLVEDFIDDILYYFDFDNILFEIKSFVNKVKSFFSFKTIGAEMRKVVEEAFENIPGLDTIRKFFDDIVNMIKSNFKWFFPGEESKVPTVKNSAQDIISKISKVKDDKDIRLIQLAYDKKNIEAIKAQLSGEGVNTEEVAKSFIELADKLKAQGITKDEIGNKQIQRTDDMIRILKDIADKTGNTPMVSSLEATQSNTLMFTGAVQP